MALSTPRPRLLIVEDDELISTFMVRGLRASLDVEVASGGGEALGRLRDGDRFDLVLSDVHLHDLSGIELRRRLVELDPRLADRVAFMTGGMVEAESLAALPASCLDKPFTIDQLRDFLRAHGLDL